jgi:carbonic anhydrase
MLTGKGLTTHLREGVHHFRTVTFPQNRELYEDLAEKQVPHTLFLTCGDSRIDPCALTNASPGEIFVERTPGNVVPLYSDAAAVGVSASIEYSIVVLNVNEVIVCGHSSCGAMKGLIDPEELKALPATARWLQYSVPALQQLERDGAMLNEAGRLKRLSQLNVIRQLENLRSHPAVDAGIRQGTLSLHGWYYEIHTAKVEVYNAATGAFEEWG